jgi:hypothetical protein
MQCDGAMLGASHPMRSRGGGGGRVLHRSTCAVPLSQPLAPEMPSGHASLRSHSFIIPFASHGVWGRILEQPCCTTPPKEVSRRVAEQRTN